MEPNGIGKSSAVSIHPDILQALREPPGCCANHELCIVDDQLQFTQTSLLSRIFCCVRRSTPQQSAYVRARVTRYYTGQLTTNPSSKPFRFKEFAALYPRPLGVAAFTAAFAAADTIKLSPAIQNTAKNPSCCSLRRTLVVQGSMLDLRRNDLFWKLFFCYRPKSSDSTEVIQAIRNHLQKSHNSMPIVATIAEACWFGENIPRRFYLRHLRQLIATAEQLTPNTLMVLTTPLLHADVAQALEASIQDHLELTVKNNQICFQEAADLPSDRIMGVVRAYLKGIYPITTISEAERIVFGRLPATLSLRDLTHLSALSKQLGNKFYEVDQLLRWLSWFKIYLQKLLEPQMTQSSQKRPVSPSILVGHGHDITKQQVTQEFIKKTVTQIPISGKPKKYKKTQFLQNILNLLDTAENETITAEQLRDAIITQMIRDNIAIANPYTTHNGRARLLNRLIQYSSADELPVKEWCLLLAYHKRLIPEHVTLAEDASKTVKGLTHSVIYSRQTKNPFHPSVIVEADPEAPLALTTPSHDSVQESPSHTSQPSTSAIAPAPQEPPPLPRALSLPLRPTRTQSAHFTFQTDDLPRSPKMRSHSLTKTDILENKENEEEDASMISAVLNLKQVALEPDSHYIVMDGGV
jgi:hypothetical protein